MITARLVKSSDGSWDKPESLKLCRDPQPDRPLKQATMSHSDHFHLHEPSSEDHFDNWIEPFDPWARDYARRQANKWSKVRQESASRYYEQVNLYRVAIDSQQLRKNLAVSVQKTNEWLHKHSLIGYPDSPVNIFINFFKKEVRGDRTIDKVVKAHTVNLDTSKGYISHLSFYDTNWPAYSMSFYRELTTAAKQLDFNTLKSGPSISTFEGVETGVSVSAAMAPGLSRLANYTF